MYSFKYYLKFLTVIEILKTKKFIPRINPFIPNDSFLYPLKASENLTVFFGNK